MAFISLTETEGLRKRLSSLGGGGASVNTILTGFPGDDAQGESGNSTLLDG